jgi:hypothetical protein
MVKVDNRTIHFGEAGSSDFTKHKDDDRKRSYIARHKKRENWRKSGIQTAGFWSRWLLWNLTTLTQSKHDIESRFGVQIISRR